MKNIFNLFLVATLLIFVHIAHSQINAITETGDEVLLFSDGSWKYLNESYSSEMEIPFNKKEFVLDKNSTFLVKSKKLDVGIWINPKEWSFVKGAENDDAEYNFQLRGEDLYAVFISEKIQIPIETLKDVAIENAKSVAPDIQVLKQEYRMVNGVKLLMMQMSGTVQGMKAIYYGYYYSNSGGTIQLLTYTGENLYEVYLPDIESFLNGFVGLTED